MTTETTPTKGRPKASKDKVILKIANSFITLGETYEVIPKKDISAPDGMQEKGTTKFLNEGNKEVRALYFDETRNAFDTGFYLQSWCHSNILKEDEGYIKQYNTFVREPYEKMFNVDCSETNFKFWDKYRYEVRTNKSYKTSDPKDMFDLFHALMQARVCEPNEKDNILQKANYNIRNLEVEKTNEEQRLEDKFAAAAEFGILLKTDKEKLYSVLEWMQMTSVRLMEDKVINTTFLRFFDDAKNGYEFARRFMEGLKMYDTPHGKTQMELFSITQQLLIKNKVEKKNNQLYLDGILIGNTPQEVSQKALNNEELAENLKKAYKNAFVK